MTPQIHPVIDSLNGDLKYQHHLKVQKQRIIITDNSS